MRRFLFVLLCALAPWCAAQSDVDALLAARDAPPGVVFEIVEGDLDALNWALPQVTELSERLRQRFPDLPIAVVTHGTEQFALLSNRRDGQFAPIHDQALDLKSDDIDLHVCGVHAGWYDKSDSDFPAYVDVAASGPAQIRLYEDFGYVLIRLEGPGG